MKWEGLNLHLENLMPGVVSLVLIYALLPHDIAAVLSSERIKEIIKSEFIAAGVFVASAYMLGVLIVAVSRFSVDRLSELFPRPHLLRKLSRGALSGKSNKEINEEYRSKICVALSSSNEAVKTEIIKRRERGRLARTSVVPTLLFVLLLTSNSSLWVKGLSLLCTIIFVLFVYAYIEETIYEECLLV
jgi:hypothetical protein